MFKFLHKKLPHCNIGVEREMDGPVEISPYTFTLPLVLEQRCIFCLTYDIECYKIPHKLSVKIPKPNLNMKYKVSF